MIPNYCYLSQCTEPNFYNLFIHTLMRIKCKASVNSINWIVKEM